MRLAKKINRTRKSTTNKGKRTAMIAVVNEPIHSPVATTKFPKPPVETVERPRTHVVPI